MTKIELKLDAEPKDNYSKAAKLLLETDNAVQLLTQQELQKLAQEYLQYKGMHGLYQMMRQQKGW